MSGFLGDQLRQAQAMQDYCNRLRLERQYLGMRPLTLEEYRRGEASVNEPAKPEPKTNEQLLLLCEE